MTHGRRPRVLLADDTDTVRELTRRVLERMGCDVDAAEDGDQALGLAREARYDLILLDLDMPLMDGTEAARGIRTLPSNRSTMMLAVSAFLGAVGDPSDRWRVFDGEIPKPVSIDRLRQVISAASPPRSDEFGPVVADGSAAARKRQPKASRTRRTRNHSGPDTEATAPERD